MLNVVNTGLQYLDDILRGVRTLRGFLFKLSGSILTSCHQPTVPGKEFHDPPWLRNGVHYLLVDRYQELSPGLVRIAFWKGPHGLGTIAGLIDHLNIGFPLENVLQ